jgi:RHS repeat-associated protein
MSLSSSSSSSCSSSSAVGFPKPPEAPPQDPSRCPGDYCGCHSGPSGGNSSGGSSGVVAWSSYPVRYGNGEIKLASDDLSVGGFGMSWGHRRVFSNRLEYTYNYGNGCNWIPQQWQHLVDVYSNGSEVVAVMSTEDSVWFDKVSSVYEPRHGAKDTLSIDGVNHELLLHRTDGSTSTFYDFTQTLAGRLKKVTSPGGQTITATYDGDGLLAEFLRTFNDGSTTTEESFVYAYINDSMDPNDGNLESVLCRRRTGGGAWSSVERCRYIYHSGTTDHGNATDLERAIGETWDGSAWVENGTTYYRYYKDSAGGTGYKHGLKLVLEPEAYANASSPLTADDSTLKTVADYYFEYDGLRRVTREENGGGSATSDFAYTQSAHANAIGNWHTKTVETLSDGSQNFVYTNYLGQVLVKETRQGSDSWTEAFKYDSAARRIEHAMPSAVISYNDANANLGVSYQTSSGVVYVQDFYTTTTATSGTVGGAIGYLRYEKVRQGSSGTAIKLRELKYFKNTASGFDIFPIGEVTVFRSDASGGSDPATTLYEYAFFTGTHRTESRTAKMPAVPTAENGENVIDEVTDVFDELGNLRWNQGARGFIRRILYDVTTGGMIQRIEDVNTTLVTGEPSGWTTPAGGGLHVTTDYALDAMGRVTEMLGPVHPIDLGGMSAQDVRSAQWTVYSSDGQEVRRSRGYRLGSGTAGTVTLVNPVSITKLDAQGRVREQIEAERASTSTLVTAAETFARSTYRQWTTHQFDSLGRLTSTRAYHSIPASGEGTAGTNYDETAFNYDGRGRLARSVSPGGTIRRTVYDALGRVTSEWIGTDDVPTSGTWSPTNTAGANLVKISGYIYDDDADGGDSNLTQHTAYVNASATRITSYGYDWRNRRTTATQPADDAGRVTYMQMTYDNLDRATTVATFEDPAVGSDVMLSKRQTLYDVRGRVYDTVGRLWKTIDPLGREDRREYDAAGRVIREIQNYQDGDPTTGNNDEDITLERSYTADGLLSTLIAKQKSSANDQTTTYVYGTSVGGITPEVYRSDLLRAEIYPDSDDPTSLSGVGTDGLYDRVEYKYNRLGERIEKKDQNGTVHTYEYDALGRVVRDKVTPGTDVDDAVLRLETFYNIRGLVAQVTSYDHLTENGTGHVVNQVVREYNDFNLLVREYQEHDGAKDASTPSVQYAYDDTADGNGELTKGMRLKSTTYPDARKIHATYGTTGSIGDALNRLAAWNEDNGSGSPGATVIASYHYLGLNRPILVEYAVPDVRLDLDAGTAHTYAGLDRFGRVVDHRWIGYASGSSSSSSSGGEIDVDRYKYGYDRAGNRTWRENVVAGALLSPVHLDEFYAYDDVYRLVSMDRGNLTGTPPTGISSTPTVEEDWTLDSLGNWQIHIQKSGGTTTLDQFRVHNKVNELTQLTKLFFGVDWQDPTYDRNGNMISGPWPRDPGWPKLGRYVYDAWNRLVKVDKESFVNQPITQAEFEYDALHRRVVKLDRAADPDVTTHYYYSDQWQVLEERIGADGSSARVDAAYVYHPHYVDAVAVRYWDSDSSGGPDTEHYYLQDANFNVTAIVTDNGTVIERYCYRPYGESTVLDADFTPDSGNESDIDNELQYTGRRIDPETGLQLNRFRFYHQQLGRFITRDPIEYFDDWNFYAYVHQNPIVQLDPSGLGCKVYYNCVLVSESTTGLLSRNCEYACTEDKTKGRKQTATQGCLCDNPNIPPTITWGRTEPKWNSCRATLDTSQTFVESPTDLRDCSREDCRKELREQLKKMKWGCSLLPPGPARQGCQRVIDAFREAASVVCDACKRT